MHATRLALGVVLLVGLCMASGCTKRFNVVFSNDTGKDLEVTLRGPGTIVPSPSAVPAHRNGGEALFKVVVKEKTLPANYEWQAGSVRGSLIVDKDSKEDQIIHITDKETTTIEINP